MILSRLDLEAIAAAITKDFFQSNYGDEVENPNRFVLATPMNALAKDYLRLRVSYAPLSPDGSICGLTVILIRHTQSGLTSNHTRFSLREIRLSST